MRDLTVATTQDLDEPVYYKGDNKLLMVLYTSEWDSCETVLESNATLNLETGEVECLEIEDDVAELDMLDREFITVGGKELEIEDACFSEDDDNFNEIKTALNRKKMTEDQVEGMLAMLKNGISFKFDNGAVFKANTEMGYIELVSDEPLTPHEEHYGVYNMSSEGLRLALKDSDLFPYGPIIEIVKNDEYNTSTITKQPKV